MPRQRLQRTGPNTDIFKQEALGQGKTEPCLVFPARAEQTSRVQAPTERRDGPGPQIGASLALLSLRSGISSGCFNEESRSGMMV